MNVLYAPVIKWKAGEQRALERLDETQKACIRPIIEFVDEFPQSPNEILDYYRYPAYISNTDTEGIDYKALLSLCSQNAQFIPVIQGEDFFTVYQENKKDISGRLCIQVVQPDGLGKAASEIIQEILDVKDNDPNTHFDLLLDMQYVSSSDMNIKLFSVRQVLQSDALKSLFESIILASTSFPTDLSAISAEEDRHITRLDKKAFQKIKQEFPLLPLVYSDYGVTRFTGSELDFSRLRHAPHPKAKYTTQNTYWILKGSKKLKHPQLATMIAGSEFFYGEDFSFGDQDILARANGKTGPGSNTNWVTIAANHHIAVVLAELSN